MPETPDYDLIRPPDETTTELVRERSTGPWPLLTILIAIAVLIGGVPPRAAAARRTATA